VELWAASLRDIKARMRPLFTQTWVSCKLKISFVWGWANGGAASRMDRQAL
jgi:hypothetical protein